jgi:CrtC N-terminal lipocalin domain
MKDYAMKIRAISKDHDDSSGTRVVLPGLANTGTDNPTRTFPFLRSHAGQLTHRSATEEWQPHRAQGDRSIEWWNLTAAVSDLAGMRYFLSWTVTHPGRCHLGPLPPQVIAQIRPGQGLYAGRFTLISYQASIRKAGVPVVFVLNDREVWDEEASTLRLRDTQHQHECAWSFDGERMDLAVCSPALAVNLRMQGGSQVMWADHQPGTKSLVRDRADGGHSVSYSLPHLRIAGSITYDDEDGKPTTVDVSGAGWADRQWGDFLADQGC